MITVFGSLSADLVTRVKHLPTPGETVTGPAYTVVPGGKGANQALAAARAGAAVRMVGAVGGDGFRDLALSGMRDGGVDLTGVADSPEKTACAFIAVDDKGENLIFVASGANLDARAAQLNDAGLTADDVLLLQMEITHAENWKAVEIAKAAGAKIVLNLAPAGPIPEESLRRLDVLVVNETEAGQLGTQLGLTEQDPEIIAAKIAADFDLDCIVTLGPAGTRSFGPSGRYSVPALSIDVVDTTAAGDSFVGAFAAGLDQGLAMEQALRQGSVAGSLACRAVGAQPSLPLRDEITAHLAALPETA
ncbi:ribokinase [Pelagibius litoralis]|uniref:Ribokinase n=1 Tax=Pelagibius litoralis TaxID=374515 RepID=A0A967KC59_9PROT|nr:ribokinase [Pelagibius litoralis]NIA70694.1 ribokinase [Pelagibius litoralis]